MNPNWLYLKHILRHKWYVFLECCLAGLFWRGLLHDLSRFLPDEWRACVRYFYNIDGSIRTASDRDDDDLLVFALARLHHQNRNPHHWQYWVLLQLGGDDKLMPMSDTYRKEMLANWRGERRAESGKDDTPSWYGGIKDKIEINTQTRVWVERQLYGD